MPLNPAQVGQQLTQVFGSRACPVPLYMLHEHPRAQAEPLG